LRADAAPISDFSKKEAVPIKPKSWRKEIVVASPVLLLALAGYLFWRHYQRTALPQTVRVMLAVLPFENLTGDPAKEYLADGLTEETISQLGRLNPEQLGVIARTSVMEYKHKDERPDQIGRDLSVQYVLENSLRENGDRIRLTAQLIQVKDQTHLRSQDFDYPAKDILNVEDDVAEAVAHEIGVRLTARIAFKPRRWYGQPVLRHHRLENGWDVQSTEQAAFAFSRIFPFPTIRRYLLLETQRRSIKTASRFRGSRRLRCNRAGMPPNPSSAK
jgi:TolB-like protein